MLFSQSCLIIHYIWKKNNSISVSLGNFSFSTNRTLDVQLQDRLGSNPLVFLAIQAGSAV